MYGIRCIFWIYILLGAGNQWSVAQDTLQIKSIENTQKQQQTEEMYKNLQNYSKKNRLVSKLHQLIFRTINSSQSNTSQQIEKNINRNFKQFQGKIIRKIHIQSLDPFGYSEKDSTILPDKMERIGNALHNKTKRSVIRRLLLFKKHSPLDSLLVKESERVIRSQNYIRRVLITPVSTSSSDSIDVHVRVLDSWSMFFDADGSTNYLSIRGRERNFLGLGHRISTRYNQEIPNPQRNGFSASYQIPNIYNTHINTYVYYSQNFNNKYEKTWAMYRPYFSVYTQWAGGIDITEKTFDDRIPYKDSSWVQEFKIRHYDLWGSLSVPVLKKYTQHNRITNFTLSVRYKHLDYLKSPNYQIDSLRFFTKKNLYLTALGLSNIGYEQDRYIFRHEDIEDVPTGKTLSLLSGFEENIGKIRPYFGLKMMYGDYWEIGYVGADLQIGTFYAENGHNQTTFRAEITYFSKLFQMKSWHFRQFVKLRSVMGWSRKNYIKDRINLNGEEGIRNFNSPILNGTRKHIISFQTQSYSPFSWLGFRISPFFTTELGFIGQEGNSFFKDPVFPKFNIGFNITNDYILFGNFQFSFFYIPRVPGVGERYNFSGTSNDDFRLPNFNYHTPDIIRFE